MLLSPLWGLAMGSKALPQILKYMAPCHHSGLSSHVPFSERSSQFILYCGPLFTSKIGLSIIPSSLQLLVHLFTAFIHQSITQCLPEGMARSSHSINGENKFKLSELIKLSELVYAVISN